MDCGPRPLCMWFYSHSGSGVVYSKSSSANGILSGTHSMARVRSFCGKHVHCHLWVPFDDASRQERGRADWWFHRVYETSRAPDPATVLPDCPDFDGTDRNTHWEVLRNHLGLQHPDLSRWGVFPHCHDARPRAPSQIDYPLWSISVEWHIYFLFPLPVFMWQRIGSLWTTATVSVASYALYMLLVRFGFVLANGFSSIVPQYIALFTVGMLGATTAFSPEPRWRRLRVCISWTLVAACAFGAFVFVNSRYTLPDYGILDGLLGIGIGMRGVMVTASRGERNIVRC
jgi:hypothetical protein